jgi:hypothetical protein
MTEITGKVVRYSRQSMGSFRNVLLEGQKDFITIGIGEGLTYPKPGQTITVTGVMRNGRFLTSDWNYA